VSAAQELGKRLLVSRPTVRPDSSEPAGEMVKFPGEKSGVISVGSTGPVPTGDTVQPPVGAGSGGGEIEFSTEIVEQAEKSKLELINQNSDLQKISKENPGFIFIKA
jgi:hypothetical protein